MAYAPLATDDDPTSTPSRPRWRPGRPSCRVILALISCVLVAHYLILLSTPTPLPDPLPSANWISTPPPPPRPPPLSGARRDATPIASAQHFLALAEAEVAALGLDTCGDEVGRAMIRAAARRRVVYCASDDSHVGGGEEEEGYVTPGDLDAKARLDASSKLGARIECMPLRPLEGISEQEQGQGNSTPSWWPATSAPCISRHLQPVYRINQRHFLAPQCRVTRAGEALNRVAAEAFMGGLIVEREESRADEREEAGVGRRKVEGWKGKSGAGRVAPLSFGTAKEGECKRVLGHTVMFVQRQDQWNPFHVAEDLIMTLVSLLIAGEAVPELTHHRVQMAFLDNFGLDGNRFAGVWDRVGAIPPRRTRHEPFDDGTCSIHGVFGRTSLLSASGLRARYDCVSTLTWAAAHYYRHLFGLVPPPLGVPVNSTLAEYPSPTSGAINILYVSRGHMRHHLGGHMGQWQENRELYNEASMVARWRRGLREMCAEPKEGGGPCTFVDADAYPEVWATPSSGGRREIRFAPIDPIAHSLDTQVHLAGHATILVGQHGGALGLALYLPPGRGAVLELAVPLVMANHHFQHLATQLGHVYRRRHVVQRVDTERAWKDLGEIIEAVEAEEARRREVWQEA